MFSPGLREPTLLVKGYREVMRAFDASIFNLGVYFRKELKRVGEIVRMDAAARFQPYDKRSAAGYRTYVTQMHVNVGQSIRATTHQHPEYGKLQMTKALLPALHAKQDEIEARFELALQAVIMESFWRQSSIL
jgi:hypothetical protein